MQSPHPETGPLSTHQKWMQSALALAEEALLVGEVPVGCVFVSEGRVVGAGRNRTNETLNATRHAEFEAIDAILANNASFDFSQCDLYVTIEPCVMCASALRHMNVRKVFFGAGNDRFGGCGSVLNIHQDRSISSIRNQDNPPYEVESGFYKEEAIMMLRKFYLRENNSAPNPKKKNNRLLKEVV